LLKLGIEAEKDLKARESTYLLLDLVSDRDSCFSRGRHLVSRDLSACTSGQIIYGGLLGKGGGGGGGGDGWVGGGAG